MVTTKITERVHTSLRLPETEFPRSVHHSFPQLPLDGVRVVELGIQSPSVCVAAAGYRLAALGAEVIKVEPLGGDTLRESQNRTFAQYNRGESAPAPYSWTLIACLLHFSRANCAHLEYCTHKFRQEEYSDELASGL